MNSVDPEVAEQPEELIPCGSAGQVAPDWDALQAIIASLRGLENDRTLLIRAGKPLNALPTRASAPRVLIANANWMYNGTQSAMPLAYEVFRAAARKHFGGSLAGRLVVAGGMGGMGGAQPLAATLNGAAFLGIDADAERIKRRLKAGYCDVLVNSLDEALRILKNAVRKRENTSVGLIGNCSEVVPELARRGVLPDLLTDQTSADDPLGGYIPHGLSVEEAGALRRKDSHAYQARALDSIAAHVRGMLDLRKFGAITFDFGNRIFALASERDVQEARDIPDGYSEYLAPLYPAGGLMTLVALSGDAQDLQRIDSLLLDLFAANQDLRRWVGIANKQLSVQGLPSRCCLVHSEEAAELGIAVNELVARGDLQAPVVVGRSSFPRAAAATLIERDKISGGSDVRAEEDVFQALLAAAAGASWVWVHSSGSHAAATVHSGIAVVADGTPEMAERMARALTSYSAQSISQVAQNMVPPGSGS
jgi:urocanate hydratase